MSSKDYLFDVVVGVVRCQDRGILLVRRSKNESLSGKWEFGGGAVEKEENLREAVKREMIEETGLKVTILDKGDPYFDDYSKGGKLKLHPFLLDVEINDQVELSHEHDRFEWVELEELNQYDTIGDLEAIGKPGLKE